MKGRAFGSNRIGKATFSKQFKLGCRFRGRGLFAARDGDHIAELAVRDLNNGNESFGRDGLTNAIDVNRAGFIARAMPDIDGPLHHGESIPKQVLAEARRGLAVLFGFCGQIE